MKKNIEEHQRSFLGHIVVPGALDLDMEFDDVGGAWDEDPLGSKELLGCRLAGWCCRWFSTIWVVYGFVFLRSFGDSVCIASNHMYRLLKVMGFPSCGTLERRSKSKRLKWQTRRHGRMTKSNRNPSFAHQVI